MKKQALLLVTFLIIFSSCSTTRSNEKSSERAAYTGKDQIQEIQPNMIIGEWSATILNPIKGEEIMKSIRSNYKDDGTLTMIIHTENENGVMPMTFELKGIWVIENDRIIQTLDSVEETSGNVLAAIGAAIASGMEEKQSGVLNIYQASEHTLVIVGETGQAQKLVRLDP